eukprot:3594827-Karenia_brevis.AAC.2
MLRRDVFVMRTFPDMLLLVHPITKDNSMYMPVAYAYATMMRRAQGATSQLVGLWFDRKQSER